VVYPSFLCKNHHPNTADTNRLRRKHERNTNKTPTFLQLYSQLRSKVVNPFMGFHSFQNLSFLFFNSLFPLIIVYCIICYLYSIGLFYLTVIQFVVKIYYNFYTIFEPLKECALLRQKNLLYNPLNK
jgi:hypothetical protein